MELAGTTKKQKNKKGRERGKQESKEGKWMGERETIFSHLFMKWKSFQFCKFSGKMQTSL